MLLLEAFLAWHLPLCIPLSLRHPLDLCLHHILVHLPSQALLASIRGSAVGECVARVPMNTGCRCSISLCSREVSPMMPVGPLFAHPTTYSPSSLSLPFSCSTRPALHIEQQHLSGSCSCILCDTQHAEHAHCITWDIDSSATWQEVSVL